jgi:hypothetical protein
MKKLYLSVFIAFACVFISTCASVKTQGIKYFINKSETDLIKYFGYNGVEIKYQYGEYDKVMLFTNKFIKYQMNKTNYTDYKTSKQTTVMSLVYNQFSDGCVTYNDATYYGMHKVVEGVVRADGSGRYVVHRNDNAALVPQINQFNNLINRYTSYPSSQRNVAFDRSNIGDSYYLYDKSSKSYYDSGVPGFVPAESYTNYICYLYLINIFSETRANTEKYTVVMYNERLNQCYDSNNKIITVERANEIIKYYENNGFKTLVIPEGYTVYAFIKNGKIIKVEDKINER